MSRSIFKAFNSAVYLLVFLMISTGAFARIKLPGLVGDNMILQRGIQIPVWGWAVPGEQLQVIFREKTYNTAALPDGTWKIKMDEADAGGPYDMEIKSQTDDITLKNILLGDVWLCSGQSNMVFDFNNPRAKALYAQDIASSKNDDIRQVLVSRGYASFPAANCKTTGWRMASPQTLNSFSAVAYFYALNLYKKYHVPIGIINTSDGGTIAEAWTSEEGLKELPRYASDILFLNDSVAVKNKVADFQNKVTAWDKTVDQNDKGYDAGGNPIWAMPNADDSQWTSIPQPDFWGKSSLGTFFGSVWMRKEIEVPADAVGKDATIILGQIDDVDITYFNGHEIGRSSNRDIKRRYKIPAALVKPGKNILTIRVINYNGTGGIFPGDTLRFQSGSERVSLSGTWKLMPGAKMDLKPKIYEPKYLPTSLFNAMVAPLIPYAIKGVLWYQGEYNAHQAFAYQPLFQALIKDWRAKWGEGDIPFVFTQLPNFQPVYDHPIESEWAELREAQSMALSQPNTAMAVTIDVGEGEDIHPVDKKDVGYRLSLAARKLTYGDKKLVASGPVFKHMKVDGGKIILTFETFGSPMVCRDGGDLKFFAIAGDDKKFVWAKAVINGNNIEVSAPEVPNPVAVRYAWAGNPAGCNLFNAAGLPASPFRTDDWPGMTVKN